jgi:hypothetical protein
MGSVLEGGADVIDGGLSGFDIEGSGFEEDVGAARGEPGVDGLVRGYRFLDASGIRGGVARDRMSIETIWVSDPT